VNRDVTRNNEAKVPGIAQSGMLKRLHHTTSRPFDIKAFRMTS